LSDSPDPTSQVDYESTPLTRSEYIAAVVHLYRGELYRSNSWRMRLDNTTNWAVLTIAGLVTFSFGEGAHSHGVLLLGFALITMFLSFEARRFRYAHVWRSRVRKIEENFYGPILRWDPISPSTTWGSLVAEDMFAPRFKISRVQALRARLLHNYWAIYLVLFSAWGMKLFMFPAPAENWTDVHERMAIGFLPWWGIAGALGAFVLALVGIALSSGKGMHEPGWANSDGFEEIDL